MFNAGAEELFGYRPSEVLGSSAARFYPSLEVAKEIMTALRNAPEGRVRNVEVTVRRKDGQDIPALISLTLIRNDRGEQAGTVGFVKDLISQKQAERRQQEELEYLERKLSEIMEVSEAMALGDFTREVRVERDDVIGKLAASFNQTARSLGELWPRSSVRPSTSSGPPRCSRRARAGRSG